MLQTKLVSVNRVALLEQLSASIAEINQPISAVVMNAEAALRLLLAQPTDTEAVRRLLACIVKDGMRTGDIVDRTRALIKESAAAIDVTHDELVMNGVSVQLKRAKPEGLDRANHIDPVQQVRFYVQVR
jgi:C4-dicarboxylate-specific signal transduction histidine kinase